MLATAQELMTGFQEPPQEARPRVWWHWMNGNITRDGIDKDIAWMHRVGIGGFHCFDAAFWGKSIVEHRLVYMSPEWQEEFRHAVSMADSLGMEVAAASCPGWSNTGGPWVKPEQAMKRLVWCPGRQVKCYPARAQQGRTLVCRHLRPRREGKPCRQDDGGTRCHFHNQR